jgi:hypothetical protein
MSPTTYEQISKRFDTHPTTVRLIRSVDHPLIDIIPKSREFDSSSIANDHVYKNQSTERSYS